jgi:4,5-DOPA dioxygenase extradiol
MNAIEENDFTKSWQKYSESLGREVRQILCISAHWYTRGTGVTAMSAPRTIYDFGGFPDRLYEVSYPAKGDPELAKAVADLLPQRPVVMDQSWGLDHGTWSLLMQMFPEANVPVVQLSIDATLTPKQHFEIGKALAPLREQGVFILGSGNVVHNLAATFQSEHGLGGPPESWNVTFDAMVRDLLAQERFSSLINFDRLGKEAELSIPTPDHYLPLLYVLGAKDQEDDLSFPTTGFGGAGISMLSVSYS